MIDLIRPHLPDGIELTGCETKRGYSLTATRDGKRSSLFIRSGQPVDYRQAALNLAYWL